MASKRVALVEYTSPSLVPAALKRVAVVTASSGRGDFLTVNPTWVANPSAAPAGVPVWGTVTYATRDLVPSGLLAVGLDEIYLLRDLFLTNRAAGAVNGTAAEPGPSDTRTVVDTGGSVSISGSEIVVATGAGSFGDPRLVYGSRARVAGRCVLFDWTPHNVPATGAYAGFSNTDTPTSAPTVASLAYRLGDSSAARLSVYDGTTLFVVTSFTNNLTYRLGVVLQATGAYFLARGGHFGTLPTNVYVLIYPLNTGNAATVYPMFMNHNAQFDYADHVLIDLANSRWTQANALAYAASASPGVNATLSTLPESVIAFTWTPGAAETLELSWKFADANNRWYLSCDQAAGTIKLYWVNGGTTTEVDAGKTQTWTVGTPYRIVVVDGLREIRTYVANVAKHVSVPTGDTSHYHSGTYTVKTSLAGANLEVYPRYLDLNSGDGQALALPDRAYAARAAAPLTTPTYDTSGEAIHPDVYDAGSGQTWNGHRYWMAMTPYPATNSDFENPSILVSDDGQTWAVPDGLTNPVIAAPGGGEYNSDPDLTMVDSTLWMVYRVSSVPDVVKATSSTDGVTWTAPVTLFTATHSGGLSPAVIYDGSQYVMFSVKADTDPHTLERRTAPAMSGPWSAPTICTITLPGSKSLWHQDVIKDSIYLYGLFQSEDSYQYLGLSTDLGFTWTVESQVCWPPQAGQWDAGHYRSSIVKTATGFDCWYSAHTGGAPDTWRTGFTQIRY